MICKLINAIIFMALFCLVLIQAEPDGSMLASGYMGLQIVAVVCILMTLANLWSLFNDLRNED